jgi:hypothetical protein
VRRLGLLCVFAVLLLPAGSGDRLLPLRQAPPATNPLTGIVYQTGAYRLAQVDAATFDAMRTSDPVPRGSGGIWTRSPDGATLALGTGRAGAYETTALQLADPATLQLVGKPIVLPGLVRTAVWPAPRALWVVVESIGKSYLVDVDPMVGRIVAKRRLDGPVVSSARYAGGLVLLLGVDEKIAPTRLAVIHPDGLVRTVPLARIRAGTFWTIRERIGHERQPGLAVDDSGSMAYVVDASWLVATVDLRTLHVAYHTPPRALLSRMGSWLTPPAQAKGLNGPVREAQWLGDGLIAVWGSNQTAVKTKSGAVYSGTPAGVFALDTRSWKVRTLDAGANYAVVGDGMLLTSGGTWSSTGKHSSNGIGAYGPDGMQHWRLGLGADRWISGIYGSRVVLGRSGNRYDVLDLQTGSIVRADLAAPFPQLLLGEGS